MLRPFALILTAIWRTSGQDHPNVGPVRGIGYGAWKKVRHFAQDGGGKKKQSLSPTCSLSACEGSDLHAAIQRDLSPWRRRGGISAKDVASGMMTGIRGWLRITFSNGNMFVRNLEGGAEGVGSRDVLFIIVLLQLQRQYPEAFPANVDFVLNPSDRPCISRRHLRATDPSKPLPFVLSFATSESQFLDVGIPDPTFWSWPEKLIRPHWQLLAAEEVVPWSEKLDAAYWRGDASRMHGALRKRILRCPHRSTLGKSTFDLQGAVRTLSASWAPPMEPARYKFALHVQGRGLTTSKQRVLASGSLPIFAEHHHHHHHHQVHDYGVRSHADSDIDEEASDSIGGVAYYSRFLKRNYHYVALRANASTMCEDLDTVIKWSRANDAQAEAIGRRARRFASTLLGPRMLDEYLLAVLGEVAYLQQLHPSRYAYESIASREGMTPVTLGNIVSLLGGGSRDRSGGKWLPNSHNPTRTLHASFAAGVASAALAYFGGEACPAQDCPQCCYHAPSEAFLSRSVDQKATQEGAPAAYRTIGPNIVSTASNGKGGSGSGGGSKPWWLKRLNARNSSAAQRKAHLE